VKDDARGLCNRLSEPYPDLAASKLGRRNRWSSTLGSSRVRAEVDATGLDDDGGSAKSVHDVGKEGLEEALGIIKIFGKGRSYEEIDTTRR
jgi:hypothetical protein